MAGFRSVTSPRRAAEEGLPFSESCAIPVVTDSSAKFRHFHRFPFFSQTSETGPESGARRTRVAAHAIVTVAPSREGESAAAVRAVLTRTYRNVPSSAKAQPYFAISNIIHII